VLGAEKLAQTPPGSLHQAGPGKDRRAFPGVEVADLPRRQPESESDGDDAAGGRAGDQIEVIGGRAARIFFERGEYRFFERGEYRCGERALDAASVEAQDSKHYLSPARKTGRECVRH